MWVRQELHGIYLAHYALRVLLAQAAVEAELDPDRLSFSTPLLYYITRSTLLFRKYVYSRIVSVTMLNM